MKGADAEDRALQVLLAQGHRLLARNYRVPGGELDLITLEQQTLVFSEVRQRATQRYGGAAQSVTPRKLDLMRRAALSYLMREYGREDVACRLQVISIEGSAAHGQLSILVVD